MDNFELTPEMLAIISGGVMNAEERENALELIRSWKDGGMTKDNAIRVIRELCAEAGVGDSSMISDGSKCSVGEMITFLDANWDSCI